MYVKEKRLFSAMPSKQGSQDEIPIGQSISDLPSSIEPDGERKILPLESFFIMVVRSPASSSVGRKSERLHMTGHRNKYRIHHASLSKLNQRFLTFIYTYCCECTCKHVCVVWVGGRERGAGVRRSRRKKKGGEEVEREKERDDVARKSAGLYLPNCPSNDFS